MSEDIKDIRKRIDTIDGQILDLFQQRMEAAGDIASYKAEHKMPVLDRARERAILAEAAERVPDELASYAQVLMSLLMEASRARQSKTLVGGTPIVDEIEAALAASPSLFPTTAFVACQGVEGAYQQIATDRIFKHANINYFDTFEGVFRAVEQGFCEYGVLPIENSTAGSVNEVFEDRKSVV